MKINEIINEDVSAEEQLSGNKLLNTNLLPVLMFLKTRAEDRELSAKLRTDSLIQLVQNAGDVTFNYRSLVDAYENNDAIKELIKNFNEEEVVLKSDTDPEETDIEHSEEEGGQPEDPTEVVKGMAHKAAENRNESVEESESGGTPNHTSSCGYNYGHDCNCGMKGSRHSDKCMYPYGGDCTCGLKTPSKTSKFYKQSGTN